MTIRRTFLAAALAAAVALPAFVATLLLVTYVPAVPMALVDLFHR
jgi:hypothetical protein